MNNPIRIAAVAVTIPCIILSFLYIILLMLSSVITLPFPVEDNVLFVDWFFLAVPILALASAVLLQISSIKKKNKQKR